MGRKYFGTDGIRGTVGRAPITPDFVLRLGHGRASIDARPPSRKRRRTQQRRATPGAGSMALVAGCYPAVIRSRTCFGSGNSPVAFLE